MSAGRLSSSAIGRIARTTALAGVVAFSITGVGLTAMPHAALGQHTMAERAVPGRSAVSATATAVDA